MSDWKRALSDYFAHREENQRRDAEKTATNQGHARLFFHTAAASPLGQLRDELRTHGRNADVTSSFDRAEMVVSGDHGREMSVAVLIDVDAEGAFPHLKMTFPAVPVLDIPFGNPPRDVLHVTEEDIIVAIVTAYTNRSGRQ